MLDDNADDANDSDDGTDDSADDTDDGGASDVENNTASDANATAVDANASAVEEVKDDQEGYAHYKDACDTEKDPLDLTMNCWLRSALPPTNFCTAHLYPLGLHNHLSFCLAIAPLSYFSIDKRRELAVASPSSPRAARRAARGARAQWTDNSLPGP